MGHQKGVELDHPEGFEENFDNVVAACPMSGLAVTQACINSPSAVPQANPQDFCDATASGECSNGPSCSSI